MGEASDYSLGVPVYNAWLQRSKLQLLFYVNHVLQSCLFCKAWKVVKPQVWLARHPPGLKNPLICPLSYLWCCWACTHIWHIVRPMSGQVGSKVRGLLCFLVFEAWTKLLSFNSPNRWSVSISVSAMKQKNWKRAFQFLGRLRTGRDPSCRIGVGRHPPLTRRSEHLTLCDRGR